MNKRTVTRRAFLGASTSAAVLMATGCPLILGQGIVVYKRSGRGLHVSDAAKKHNANHLYANRLAASLNPAHPGDNSNIVKITINRAMYDRLFPFGKTVADLRHDL